MTIKEFSEKTKLPHSTIRYYDKLGIFPSLGRNKSGYRDFSQEEVRVRLERDRLQWEKFNERVENCKKKLLP
jgi:DNA-binding transcriptional MerR regulator